MPGKEKLDTAVSLKRAAAAHASWARTEDRAARTAPAHRVFNQRFENQVDPEGLLDPRERAVRAEHARRAYYLALAAKSVEARRRKASATRKAREEAIRKATTTEPR